jgi:hypothetical protein
MRQVRAVKDFESASGSKAVKSAPSTLKLEEQPRFRENEGSEQPSGIGRAALKIN